MCLKTEQESLEPCTGVDCEVSDQEKPSSQIEVCKDIQQGEREWAEIAQELCLRQYITQLTVSIKGVNNNFDPGSF